MPHITIRHIFFTAILGILLFFVGTSLLVAGKSLLYMVTSTVTYPFLYVQKSIAQPINSFFERRKTTQELLEQIKQLQQEREMLIEYTVALEAEFDFAAETKELIQFCKRYDMYEKHLAQVLLRNFSDQGHFFLVEGGSRKGIEVDMVAIYKNCLIGRVVEVYPYYAKVVLISDKQCKVAAYCAQTKTEGIYEGLNQPDGSLAHVSHLKPLQKDERVISSGQGLVFPRGFGLGKINSYELDGIYYKVHVAPLLDLTTISCCYLIKKGTD
ncbi:MAG: rod shape-determining protein MreC [Candidatus Babeliales bacterium]